MLGTDAPSPTDPLQLLVAYGPLGIMLAVVVTLLIKGLIFSKPQVDAMRSDWAIAVKQMTDDCAATLAQVRADGAQRERLLREDLQRVEQQREDALEVVQDRVLPLLASFTATTQALLPLLQAAIPMLQERVDERHGRGRGGRSAVRDAPDG
jgi:hypothetical protein